MRNRGESLRRMQRYYREADRFTRRKIALLTLLVLLLMGMGGTWAFYLRTRKPLTSILPPAVSVAQGLKPHYLFSIYGLQRPLGVAATPAGDRIYVTESDGERLTKAFDRNGNLLFTFALPGTNPLGRAPVYVAVAPDGSVYVSDRRQHTISVYDSQGNHQKMLPPPDGGDFWAPLGLSFAGENLYITDVTKDEHRILVYDIQGQFQRTFGQEGTESGQFWFPNAVEVDGEGRIYVSDSNNRRLQVFDSQGQLLYAIGGFNLPHGTAIDDEGRLFIVDAIGQRIWAYNLNNQPLELLYEFGDQGVGDGQFNYPNDIAVDQTGRLYITDRENNRVQVWSF